MDWYKDWFGTRYYALLYGHRDQDDAARWVRAILERWGPRPGERLLDLACGRGRHALHFANAGLDVTGVDLSEESLVEARSTVPLAQFRVHDIREPYPGPAFPYITCLFTSLGYTTDPADDLRVLQAASDSLAPGGRFVLDVMNTDHVLAHLIPVEERTIDGVHFLVERWYEDGSIRKRIQVTDGGAHHTYEERLRALRPGDLTAMVIRAGLQVEDTTDGPVLEPFDPGRSQRFVLWAGKPPVG
ncbi:MAG: methyltransferase domain-containing protein [Flavobacteriales bacterium]